MKKRKNIQKRAREIKKSHLKKKCAKSLSCDQNLIVENDKCKQKKQQKVLETNENDRKQPGQSRINNDSIELDEDDEEIPDSEKCLQ